jgi:hypothetical protein
MLTSDRDDRLAEASAVEIDQAAAVLVFFSRHPVEHRGRSWIVASKLSRVSRIDPRVLLLGGNRESEDLLLGEIVEAPFREA